MSLKTKIAGGLLAGAGATALAGAAWATFVEPQLFTLQRYQARLLPKGSKPVTILQLSDLHLAPWQHSKQEWVRLLAKLSPDLIINTGDNFGHRDALPGIRYALEPFAGIPGVFVTGSNDYFGPQPKNPLGYLLGGHRLRSEPEKLDTNRMLNLFEQDFGWINLNNNAAVLDLSDVRLEFFGVDDPHIQYDRLDHLPQLLDELRDHESLRETSSASVTIGVTHAPYRRVLDTFTTYGAELIFAGHTHGGQVRIPGLEAAPVTNTDLPGKFARGTFAWPHARRESIVSVSAGLGASIYTPFRFACRPEATLFTLTD